MNFKEMMPDLLNLQNGNYYQLNKDSTIPMAKPILEVPKIDYGIPENQLAQEIQTLHEKNQATPDEINQAIDATPQITKKEEAKSFAQNILEKLIPTKTVDIKPDQPKDPDVSNYLKAFGSLETGGEKNPYQFSKTSGDPNLGRDLGKYQVTEGELKTYAKRYLGKDVTPEEFLNSPTIQDQYMTGKIRYFISKGASPERIFGIHRQGAESAPGSAKDYGKKGVNLLQ